MSTTQMQLVLCLRTDTGLQEFWSDPAVLSDSISDFPNICAGNFTHGWHGINTGDTLGKECIGGLRIDIQLMFIV